MAWLIVKTPTGTCEIVASECSADSVSTAAPAADSTQETWGPYPTQAAAIAKRVGLIRAGKCRPL